MHPHGKLSYKVNKNLAVYPETHVSFRPTGRTPEFNALLIDGNAVLGANSIENRDIPDAVASTLFYISGTVGLLYRF